MNILTITKLYPPIIEGGYEVHCASTVDLLSRDHNVMVLTTEFRSDEVVRREMVRRTLPYALYTSAVDGRRSFAQSVTATSEVRAVLAQFQPDLVYIWHASGMPHAAIAAVLDTELPVILSIDDYWPHELNRVDPYMKGLIAGPRSMRGAAAVIHNSIHPAMRLSVTEGRPVDVVWISDYLRRNVELPRTMRAVREATIVPASPNADIFEQSYEARDELRKVTSPESPHLLFAGRVVRDKGPHFLVECAGSLLEHFPSLSVRIAGGCDAETERDLRAVAALAGLASDQLSIFGMLAPQQLADEMRIADVFVMPSLWPEPGGISLLDAASAGVPIVASAAGGMPEMMKPYEHALFFEPGNHAECIEAIRLVLTERIATEVRRLGAHKRSHQLRERYAAATMAFVESYDRGNGRSGPLAQV